MVVGFHTTRENVYPVDNDALCLLALEPRQQNKTEFLFTSALGKYLTRKYLRICGDGLLFTSKDEFTSLSALTLSVTRRYPWVCVDGLICDDGRHWYIAQWEILPVLTWILPTTLSWTLTQLREVNIGGALLEILSVRLTFVSMYTRDYKLCPIRCQTYRDIREIGKSGRPFGQPDAG